jgi:hypothetical protein
MRCLWYEECTDRKEEKCVNCECECGAQDECEYYYPLNPEKYLQEYIESKKEEWRLDWVDYIAEG